MGSPKKISAAAARRMRAELLAAAAKPPEGLPAALEDQLRGFSPHSLNDADWARVRPVVEEIMRRSHIRGNCTFRQHLSDVTGFVAWAMRHGHPLDLCTILDHALIEEWARIELASLAGTTRRTRRSRLRSLASDLNPGLKAPGRGVPIPRQAIRPPYEPADEAAIVRIARTQPSHAKRRTMCLIVGLGFGAGLDSTDLRALTAAHVDDRGDDGIWITVPGTRPRVVVVRRRYEELVRIGVHGMRPGAVLIGRSVDRKSITGAVLANADILGDAPLIEQSRMRSTWLVELMVAPIPLATITKAAGLVGARSLTDLLPYAADRLGLDVLREVGE